MRSELESSQRMQACVFDPCQHPKTGSGAQSLLGRPQRLCGCQCSAHQQAARIDATFEERRCIRQIRWMEPRDAARLRVPLFGNQPLERRDEKAELTDAGRRMQDLDEPGTRPAAARQAFIETRAFAWYAGI